MMKALTTVVLCLGLGFASHAGAQTDFDQANRYLCYVVEGIKAGGHEGGNRRARDQFGNHQLRLFKPRMICNPVDLTGRAVPASRVHLECYELATDERTNREVVVSSEFQDKQQIVLAAPQMMCVPAKKKLLGIVK